MYRFTCKRIENHINTFATCYRHDLISKQQRTGIKYMLNPQKAQKVTFLFRAGCCEDFCTAPAGHLDCCKPDAPGSSMDQYLLTLLETGKMLQCVPSGKKGSRDSCSRLK